MSHKGDGRQLISNEEKDLRYDYAYGLLDIDETEMKKRIEEIRERVGKP